MAEKTDEEIIKEVGLETTDDTNSEELLEELSIDTNFDKTLEKNNESTNNQDSKENDSTKNSSNEEENKSSPVQKKQPKIYRILIGVVAFLLLILTVGIILYFLGYFDPEEPVKKSNKKSEIEKIDTNINFNAKELNKTRLNKKLSMLTKHEIMNRNELEAEEKRIKEEEKKKKETEQKIIDEKKKKETEELAAQYAKIEEEKRIIEERQKNIKQKQEDFLRIQEEAKMELETKRLELVQEFEKQKLSQSEILEDEQILENKNMDEEVQEDIEEEEPLKEDIDVSSQSFLNFINVATIKGELYKSFLDEVQNYDNNLSLCRDYKNRIEILFGPYESKEQRENVFSNLLNNGFKEAYLIDFTNEEYQKRCKY
jgi:hypothetical protein